MCRAERIIVFVAVLVGFASISAARADGQREHPLLAAIRGGDRALLESLLREGTPANVRTADGSTPLMFAARHGTPDMVATLLRHGADPLATDDRGGTALLYAVGDLRKVELLLARGADVNARSAAGNTPLIAAAAYPGNLPVVERLVEKGATTDAVNDNNASALSAAVYASDPQSVRYFLKRGGQAAPIKNLFGTARNSPLVIAAQMGDSESVDLLLQHGADVNSQDENFGGHALNYALLAQRPDIALRLIEAGADVKLCSHVGRTPPIVLAAYLENGDPSVVRRLVERGADAAATTESGETALTWARRRGFPNLIAALAAAGVPEPPDPRPALPHRELPADSQQRASLLRAAVTRSVALMQRSSDVFLEQRRACVSCHHQNLQGVALGWARDRGFAVDEASIARMVERQLSTWSRRVDAAYEMDRPLPVPPQLAGYGLWGLSALGQSGDAVTDAYAWYLAAIQQPDGHWVPGGITRPPMGGGEILSTVLAMRGLQLYPPPGDRPALRARLEKTKLWLASSRPAGHQDLAYKVMGLGWAGVPPELLQADVRQLLSLQRPDGGWSQLPHTDSDAWATGQSLVALRLGGGLPAEDAAVGRGVEFLLRTQFDDGSWYVQSRAWPFQPPFDSGFPFGRDQWISAGATAWATMAILLNLAPDEPAVVPSRSDPPAAQLAREANKANAKAAAAGKSPDRSRRRRAEPVDFARDIRPVIERSCAGCHSGAVPEGGFTVTERAALLRGGESGEAAVVPGRGESSPLLARIAGEDPELAMPPPKKRDKYPALSDDEVEALRTWIDAGAPWPDGVTLNAKPN